MKQYGLVCQRANQFPDESRLPQSGPHFAGRKVGFPALLSRKPTVRFVGQIKTFNTFVLSVDP
jgi:hypothetical protein